MIEQAGLQAAAGLPVFAVWRLDAKIYMWYIGYIV